MDGAQPGVPDHIGRVLPSLGESDVVFMTVGDLVPGLDRHRRGRPGGRAAQGLAEDPRRARGRWSPIGSGAEEFRCRSALTDVTAGAIDEETAEWAIHEAARQRPKPHNEARAVFTEIVTYVLTERAIARIGKGWLTREQPRKHGSSCGRT